MSSRPRRSLPDGGRGSKEQVTHMEPLQAWAPNLQSLLPPAVGQTQSEKKLDPWSDVPSQLPSKGPGDRNGRRVRPPATTAVKNEGGGSARMHVMGDRKGQEGWEPGLEDRFVTRFEAGTWAI